jgi:glycosyltransferase involved in cell wall biosynthesis
LWKEIIDSSNCGLTIDPKNPSEIANAIQYLLENDEIAEQMGKNGRKAILEKYNWEAEGLKLIEIYNKLSLPVEF